MSDNLEKNKKEKELRCVKCGKLIAKNLLRGRFEIKCLRCGTLNIAFEEMVEQVIITDPSGKILFINKAAEDATGYNLHEAIGKKPSEMWGKQMSQEFYNEMWKEIKDGNKTFKTQVTNKRKNGELYEVDFSISPILNVHGEVMFYIGVEVILEKKL